MNGFPLPQTDPVRCVMRYATEAAHRAGRKSLTPPDVLRTLLDVADGLHMRLLVDDLHLDLNALRALARQWEFPLEPEMDWALMIMESATGEAVLAMQRYVSTEHVLLAILRLWPEAPCPAGILRAAGGTVHQVRFLISVRW